MPGVKGKTNNPNGRPRTGEAFLEQLTDALKSVEKKKGKTLMQHAVEVAYTDNQVMIALLRKLIPDIQSIKHSGNVTVSPINYGDKKEE